MLQIFVDLLKGALEFIIFDITLEIFSMYKNAIIVCQKLLIVSIKKHKLEPFQKDNRQRLLVLF